MHLINFDVPYVDSSVSSTEEQLFTFITQPLFRQVKFPRSKRCRVQKKWSKDIRNYRVNIPDKSNSTWICTEVLNLTDTEYKYIEEVFEGIINEKRQFR